MASSLTPVARRLMLTAARTSPSNKFTLARSKLPHCRVAAFHASQKQHILPPGPQFIQGGVNDPAPVPDANPAHGSYHWAFERLISVAVIPLSVAPFVSGSGQPILDALLASSMLIHSHIGFDACVTDYFPRREYGGLRKFMQWSLRAATVTVAVGLFSIQTNDVGLTETIARFWMA